MDLLCTEVVHRIQGCTTPTPFSGNRILEPCPVPKSFFRCGSNRDLQGKHLEPTIPFNVRFNYNLAISIYHDPIPLMTIPRCPFGPLWQHFTWCIPHNFFQRFSLAVKTTANRNHRQNIFSFLALCHFEYQATGLVGILMATLHCCARDDVGRVKRVSGQLQVGISGFNSIHLDRIMVVDCVCPTTEYWYMEYFSRRAIFEGVLIRRYSSRFSGRSKLVLS